MIFFFCRLGRVAQSADGNRLVVRSGRSRLIASVAAVLAACTAAAADPAKELLTDGFEGANFSPNGRLFYKDNTEQRSGTVTFQSDVVHEGRGALKLSLRPHCPRQSGPDEETGCSERAEVWERPNALAGYDNAVWYRLALRLADPIPADDGRYVLAQWKREIKKGVLHDYSPFLALRLYRGKLAVTVETDEVPTYRIGSSERPEGCRPGEALVTTKPGFRQTRALVASEPGVGLADHPGQFGACAPAIRTIRHGDLPSAANRWIDLVFRAQPGPRGNGHVEVYADGKPIVTVTGHIGHEGPGLGEKQYFKFGPYRSPSSAPWTVFYDSFARGARCAEVAGKGFCPDE